MKRLFITFFLSILTLSLLAVTYWVSPTGTDLATGRSRSAAWQTLDKVNSYAINPGFQPGDIIQFKRGGLWIGTITVSNSGNSTRQITYAAWGEGPKPVISGFTTVTAWTNLGDSIWESTNAVSTLPYLNIVLVNGRNTAMGRTPNDGAVYNIDAYSSGNWIEASELDGTPDYTGAQIVMRRVIYAWSVANVTSQSGERLNYTNVTDNTTASIDNCGFFIQAHESTLDVQNEWYYNTSTKKLRIYSTSEPTGMQVPTTESLLAASGYPDYITIKNIEFTGANSNAVSFDAGSTGGINNITINNCDFKNIGGFGTYFYNITNPTVSSNYFQHCNSGAVSDAGTSYKSTGTQVINNVIDSTYMIIGVGGYPPGAITTTGDDALVQYNTIKNVGKEAIKWNGSHPQIRNNFIDSCMLKVSDGAGIYSYNTFGINAIVDGNIILNSIGYALGTPDNNTSGRAIYMDSNSRGTTISNNSTYNSFAGVYISNNSRNINVENNTIYNSRFASVHLNNRTTGAGIEDSLYNITFKNNKYIETDAENLRIMSLYDDGVGMIDTASGNIYARPLKGVGDATGIYVYENTGTQSYFTLAAWKTWLGKDADSELSKTFTLTSDSINFYYNETKVAKVVSLPAGNWFEVDSTEYTGTVTLQPFTSIVLVKGNYDKDYVTLFANNTVKPALDTAIMQHTLVIDLKAAGVWQKSDILYVLAQRTEQGALLDWINPVGTNNVTNTTTAQFTPYEGFTGNSATNEYLTSGYNPFSKAVNYAKDNAAFSVYCRLQIASGEAVAGSGSGSDYFRIYPNSGGNFSSVLNATSLLSYANTVTQGLFTTVRRGETTTESYINGGSVANGSATSTAVPNATLKILGRSSTSTTNNQLSFVWMGAGLSDTEVSDLNTAVEKYMDAIGKGVQ